MQPTYSAEYPIQDHPHGFYGGMINFLGSACGFIGSVSMIL